jgi:glucose-6-phosphate 1-dehydrogenase
MMGFNSKIPGPSTDMRTVNMDFSYGSAFGEELPDAYERLLLDAMVGDSTLYMRKDEVDAAWAFITEILCGWQDTGKPSLSFYRAGSSGPDAAGSLLGVAERRWRRL